MAADFGDGEPECDGSVLLEVVELAKIEGSVYVWQRLLQLLLPLKRKSFRLFGEGFNWNESECFLDIAIWKTVLVWHGSDLPLFLFMVKRKIQTELYNLRRHNMGLQEKEVTLDDEPGQLLVERQRTLEFREHEVDRELVERLLAALKFLPAAQQLAVYETCVLGKAGVAVARERHVNVSAVYRNRKRGLATLRKQLLGSPGGGQLAA